MCDQQNLSRDTRIVVFLPVFEGLVHDSKGSVTELMGVCHQAAPFSQPTCGQRATPAGLHIMGMTRSSSTTELPFHLFSATLARIRCVSSPSI